MRKRDVALQTFFLFLGITLLSVGTQQFAIAQNGEGILTYNDERFAEAVNVLLTYLEGSFGALIMVVAGLAAIISAAFGQYRAALSCLIVAVGAFVLRSLISTFFNDVSIQR